MGLAFCLPKKNNYWYNMDCATIAQLVEQPFRKWQVKGPTPFGGSFNLRRACFIVSNISVE